MTAYRNGTYVAFHAGGVTDPTASDIRYYNLMKGWKEHAHHEFEFVNSHEKTQAVRDTSSRETLRRALAARLLRSKRVLFIITDMTRRDTDWVPFEIEHAADQCKIPFICVYPDFERIHAPAKLAELWPAPLAERINAGTIRAIHVPFKQIVIADALSQFDISNPPTSALSYYSNEAYQKWGLL